MEHLTPKEAEYSGKFAKQYKIIHTRYEKR
jgi:hypothetical protein